MTGLILQGEGEFKAVVLDMAEEFSGEELKAEIRDYITWMEDRLLDQDQVTMASEHWLSDHLYVRTMHVPAGTYLTGAIHKKPSITMAVSGTISVLTENGCAQITGPTVFPSAAGIRRLGYCHTDVVWVCAFSVDGTTLDEIEDELFTFANPEEA